MRRAALRFIVPLLPVLVVSACTDPVTTDATFVEITSHAVLTCDLTQGMASDVRSYFPQPERRTAQEKMRLLETACGAGDADLTQTYAVDLLAMIEALLAAGRGGDAVVGERLANALLACTTEYGCAAVALPGLVLEGPMSHPEGLFSLRAGSSAEPAVARGAIAFISEDENGNPVQNSALFGAEVAPVLGAELSPDTSWASANGSDIVLIYGQPVSEAGPALQEISIGDLAYDFNRWPRTGPFVADNVVHVGVCFLEEVVVPHDDQTGVSTQPRMQREQMLLSSYDPTFCPETDPEPEDMRAASAFAAFAALTKSLLRFSGLIALSDIKTPVIGGSAIDFSHFAPVAANSEGVLALLTVPPAVVRVGESLGPITVEARSGAGTLMERVLVTLYIAGNNGKPAGAVLLGDVDGRTSETDGTVVIDGTSIEKTGGYTICARGELAGFTFEEACTSLHILK